MMTVEMPDARKLARAFHRAPELMAEEAADAMQRAVQGFRKEWLATQAKPKGLRRAKFIFQALAKQKGFGGPAGLGLNTAASFDPARPLDGVEGRVFPKLLSGPLARFQRGGTFRPKRAKQFAIPVSRVRIRGGKGRPQKGYRTPQEFRDRFPRRKLVPIKKGSKTLLIEYQRKGRKGGYRWESKGPAFVVQPTMNTPVRLNLTQSFRRSSNVEKFKTRLAKGLNRGLKRAFGEQAVKGS